MDDLVGVGARERDGGALRVDLFLERGDLRLRDLERRARLIDLLLRDDALLHHLLGAIEVHFRVVELGLRGGPLRFGGGKVGFGLADLIGDLALLEAEGRGALLHLRAGAFRARGVERLLLLELARVEHRQQLVGLHHVALFHEELRDAAGDLRADDDVVGGDDAGEDEGNRPRAAVPVVAGAGDEDQQDERANDALHVDSNDCIKQTFDIVNLQTVMGRTPP